MAELAILFLTLGAVLFHVFALSFFHIVLTSLFLGLCIWSWAPSKKGVLAGSVLAVLCVCGALVVWSKEENIPPQLFGERTIEATILSVDRELERTSLVVRDSRYTQRVQVIVFELLSVLPGDMVSITGIVEKPEDFITDTGRLFAYKDYLESKGIVGVIYDPKVSLVRVGGFSTGRFAAHVRYGLAEVFARFVSFPTDGMVSGMVLGYQGGIPKETEELFRDTGVLHVLVLSGYNITLLGGCIGAMLRTAPSRVRIMMTFLGIIFLVLVSGAGVASVRAGVMGSIALAATLSLQQYNALRALLVSFLGFFLWSPTVLFSDPGFHLSFLATLCMIAVIPKAEALFSFIPKTQYFNMRELTMLAFLLPLFMLPYTMYFAGVAPISAVPANILLGAVTPIIMLLGSVILASASITPLAFVLGTILSFLGTIVVYLLELFSQLPSYNTPGLSAWGVVGGYGVFFLTLFSREIREFISRLRKNLLQQPSSYVQ